AFGLADLLRGRVAPRLDFLQPRLDRAQLLVPGDDGRRQRLRAAALEARVEGGGVLANGLDIEHGDSPDGCDLSVAGCLRSCSSKIKASYPPPPCGEGLEVGGIPTLAFWHPPSSPPPEGGRNKG